MTRKLHYHSFLLSLEVVICNFEIVVKIIVVKTELQSILSTCGETLQRNLLRHLKDMTRENDEPTKHEKQRPLGVVQLKELDKIMSKRKKAFYICIIVLSVAGLLGRVLILTEIVKMT